MCFIFGELKMVAKNAKIRLREKKIYGILYTLDFDNELLREPDKDLGFMAMSLIAWRCLLLLGT
jgi:hypothetical protein